MAGSTKCFVSSGGHFRGTLKAPAVAAKGERSFMNDVTKKCLPCPPNQSYSTTVHVDCPRRFREESRDSLYVDGCRSFSSMLLSSPCSFILIFTSMLNASPSLLKKAYNSSPEMGPFNLPSATRAAILDSNRSISAG